MHIDSVWFVCFSNDWLIRPRVFLKGPTHKSLLPKNWQFMKNLICFQNLDVELKKQGRITQQKSNQKANFQSSAWTLVSSDELDSAATSLSRASITAAPSSAFDSHQRNPLPAAAASSLTALAVSCSFSLFHQVAAATARVCAETCRKLCYSVFLQGRRFSRSV